MKTKFTEGRINSELYFVPERNEISRYRGILADFLTFHNFPLSDNDKYGNISSFSELCSSSAKPESQEYIDAAAHTGFMTDDYFNFDAVNKGLLSAFYVRHPWSGHEVTQPNLVVPIYVNEELRRIYRTGETKEEFDLGVPGVKFINGLNGCFESTEYDAKLFDRILTIYKAIRGSYIKDDAAEKKILVSTPSLEERREKKEFVLFFKMENNILYVQFKGLNEEEGVMLQYLKP